MIENVYLNNHLFQYAPIFRLVQFHEAVAHTKRKCVPKDSQYHFEEGDYSFRTSDINPHLTYNNNNNKKNDEALTASRCAV